ncbi:MAG: hypothetical protein PVG99_13110 [Desulfobacteraceae bacterium]|jgi:hypothetical protein
MKTIKSIFTAIALLALLWSVWSTVRPFWDRYWLKQDMELAAVFGTKNSNEDTRIFLDKKMKDAGRDFNGEDFQIERYKNNKVSISIRYGDEIRVFGMVLKELELDVEAVAMEVKEYF